MGTVNEEEEAEKDRREWGTLDEKDYAVEKRTRYRLGIKRTSRETI